MANESPLSFCEYGTTSTNPADRALVSERVYGTMSLAFCCALVISNVLAAKTISVGIFDLPASILTFPAIYIINDITSDVFGFKAMRRTILLGFVAAAVSAIAIHIAIAIPGIDAELSAAFALALGDSWRILLGSFASYLLGSLLNSFIMDGLKRRFADNLFFRCIFSTFCGETVDSVVFISIAFWGIYEPYVVLTMIGSQILFKVLYEVIMYPATKRIILAIRNKVGLTGPTTA